MEKEQIFNIKFSIGISFLPRHHSSGPSGLGEIDRLHGASRHRCTLTCYCLGHCFFIFCFTDFFWQQVSVGGRNKNKNKIHSDYFPIELKSKETQMCFLRF